MRLDFAAWVEHDLSMVHRKIQPREYAGRWYVQSPIDLRTSTRPFRRWFGNKADATDYAKQLNDARKTNLQFFFAMHPAVLAEIAFHIKEIGYDRAIAALRRAQQARKLSTRLAPDVMAEFLKSKAEQQVRKNHLEVTKSILKKFLTNPVPIGEFTREMVEEHLRGLGYKPLGTLGALKCIKSFFNWCVERDLIEESPAAKIKPPTIPRQEIKILAADDCKTLMEAAQTHCPSVIPFLALQLFGGLRAAEAARVRKDNIKHDHIRLVGADTKLNVVRIVPVSKQLAAWLAVKGGKLMPLKECYDALIPLKKKHGVVIPKNALRHSFCSFLFALGTDIDAVAKAAGNSAEILRKHYLGLASKEDAQKFAEIMPA